MTSKPLLIDLVCDRVEKIYALSFARYAIKGDG